MPRRPNQPSTALKLGELSGSLGRPLSRPHTEDRRPLATKRVEFNDSPEMIPNNAQYLTNDLDWTLDDSWAPHGYSETSPTDIADAFEQHIPPEMADALNMFPTGENISQDQLTLPRYPTAGTRNIPQTRLLKIIEAVLEDKECYKELLGATGQEAQRILDVLEKLLTTLPDNSTARQSLLVALMRLSTKSGLYPRCFVLHGVQYERQPVTAGQFGEIMRGTFKGHRVCLKVVKLYQRGQIEHLLKSCVREAIIWSHLRHSNLLPFYGIYHLNDIHGRVCLVSPWIENGNVCDYLKAHPSIRRMPLIRDIMQGLNYLHEEHIVHGDLKGANILVKLSGSACLADFGLSSIMDANILRWTSLDTMTKTGGTVRWLAPELMDDTEDGTVPRPNFACDIYSLAVVMYEVLTDQIPFYEYPRDVTVISKVLRGARPSRPSTGIAPELTDSVWHTMEKCWEHEPRKRPAMQLLTTLLPHLMRDSERMDNVKRKKRENLLSMLDFRNAMYGEEADTISASDVDIFVRLLYV